MNNLFDKALFDKAFTVIPCGRRENAPANAILGAMYQNTTDGKLYIRILNRFNRLVWAAFEDFDSLKRLSVDHPKSAYHWMYQSGVDIGFVLAMLLLSISAALFGESDVSLLTLYLDSVFLVTRFKVAYRAVRVYIGRDL